MPEQNRGRQSQTNSRCIDRESHGIDGMPAEVEEVVFDSDRSGVEQRLPNYEELLLYIVTGFIAHPVVLGTSLFDRCCSSIVLQQ